MSHDASDLRLDTLPPPQRRLWPELAQDDEMRAIARRVKWFEPPERALGDVLRFLTYLMIYGRPEDVQPVMRRLGREAFRHALKHGPRGIMDERSRAYWSLVLEK